MFENSFKILKQKNIKIEIGLTENELKEIEKRYGFHFPLSLKQFLKEGLPVSEGFYNWRDNSIENIELIKSVINDTKEYINDNPTDVYWNDNWGREPTDVEEYSLFIRDRLMNAPKLIPFFIHRFIPEIEHWNPPVFSLHGADLIYYGNDLEEYIEVEFGNKKHSEINFNDAFFVPFWSEITW